MGAGAMKLVILLEPSGMADGPRPLSSDVRGRPRFGDGPVLAAGAGTWRVLARLFRAQIPGEAIKLVHVATGETPFAMGRDPASPPAGRGARSCSDVAASGIRRAMRQGEVCAVVWNGDGRDFGRADREFRESDGRDAITRLRQDAGLGETIPFLTWTAPRLCCEPRALPDASARQTDLALERLAATVPYFGLVSSRGLSGGGDGVRLDAASQRELGERLFRMWRSMSAVSPEKLAAQAAKYRAAPRVRTRVLLDPGEFLVTSPFGRRRHPVTGEEGAMHAGVDGALWNGRMLLETGICAWREGVVSEAADGTGPAGTFAVIDHGGGWTSRSFHLEAGSLRVGPGDRVAAGALLGWMGRTGRATGEHLHFQLERDGVPVDPTPLLGR